MPISKKITTIREPLDVDLQLLAMELDTSAAYLKYLSEDLVMDAVTNDAFKKLVADIESGEGVEISSINDNTVIYEYLNEAIVVHTVLGEKYILFDSMITQKIENKLDSYK